MVDIGESGVPRIRRMWRKTDRRKSDGTREKEGFLQNETSGGGFGLKRRVKKSGYVILQKKMSGRDLSTEFADM
jgi:hypothetical protein